MKRIIFLFLVAIFFAPAILKAQVQVKRVFTYTFLGMKTAEEAQKLDKEILCMPGVISSKTIFKDAEHHAKLMIEVEKLQSVTALDNKEVSAKKVEKLQQISQENLKELLLKYNYSPADFRENNISREE